jgi:hypothetical protein
MEAPACIIPCSEEADATLECLERDGFVRRVGGGWQITALGAAMIERHEAVEAGRRPQ